METPEQQRETKYKMYQAKLDGNFSLAKRLSSMDEDNGMKKTLNPTQLQDLRTASALCRNLPGKAAEEGFVLRTPDEKELLLLQQQQELLIQQSEQQQQQRQQQQQSPQVKQ